MLTRMPLWAVGLCLFVLCAQSPSSPAGSDARPVASVTSDGSIKLSPEQIAASKIEVATVGPGNLRRTVRVPGNITMDSDRIGHVAAKVIGTVIELRKRLGDKVEKGEIVAFLESREVADAKSEFLTAGTNLELQTSLFERERTLWEKKISPEQQFLRAENAFAVSKLRHDLARQKLSALDVDDALIADLSHQPVSNLRRYALRSPIGGRVIERKVDLGAPVGGDQQEKEIYVIADLTSVWAELMASPADLGLIREGDMVAIGEGSAQVNGEGKLIFISPMTTRDTRTVKAIVELDNVDQRWRPGSFVSANLPVEQRRVDVLVPKSALQTIDGNAVAFIRTPEGFRARRVQTGAEIETAVEIVSGLRAGEIIAITNTFVLKSDLGKTRADE